MPKTVQPMRSNTGANFDWWVCPQPLPHCTMQQLKNVVKSSRLWKIFSLWMLTKKFQNFAQCSLNSPKTKIKTNIKTLYLKNRREKNPKSLFGVFAQVKIGLKKSSCNKKTRLENEHFEQTPPNSKKMHSESEKIDFLLVLSWSWFLSKVKKS